MRQLACKDAGFQQCAAVIQGKNDDEILRQAGEHAAKEHGVKNITPDMQQELRAKIKNV
jgi:predicted small metal-binding protein